MSGVVRRRVPASYRGALVAAALALAIGCTRPGPEPEPVAVTSSRTEWQDLLDVVERYALEGRYVLADSTLADFGDRYAGTAEADEARYWRALLTLDPSNAEGSPRRAIGAIDSYLTGGPGLPRYGEALVLRRLAGQIQSLRNVQPPPPPVVFIDTTQLRQRGEEILRLRDSLTQTTAELERIRQRLRTTRPETPPPVRPPTSR